MSGAESAGSDAGAEGDPSVLIGIEPMTDLIFCVAAALAAGVYLAPRLDQRRPSRNESHSPS